MRGLTFRDRAPSVVMQNPYGRCENGDCGYTEDRLMQSQLTTLTTALDGSVMRTRTAQGFDAFGDGAVCDPCFERRALSSAK